MPEEKSINPDVLFKLICAEPRGLTINHMAELLETSPEEISRALHELKLRRCVMSREKYVSDDNPQPGDARETRWEKDNNYVADAA